MKPTAFFRLVRTGSPAAYLLATAIVALLAAPAVRADLYWNGANSPTTGWEDWTNWDNQSDGLGLNPSNLIPIGTDVAYFNITGINTPQTVNLNGNQSALGLVFNSTGTTTLQGGGTNRILTLGASGITVNSLAGAVTIGSATVGQNVAITLAGPQTWTNNSTVNALTIQNGVSNDGNLLTVGGAGNTTLNGALAGTGGLIKADGGTLTLLGAPVYTGGTDITGGILYLRADTFAPNGALFSMGNLTVAAGATLSGERANMTGTLTLNGGTWFENNGFGGRWMGSVNLGATSIISSGYEQSILGVISGVGGITKTGGGTLKLSGTNTYLGTTTISAGTLQLGTGTAGRDGSVVSSIVNNATLAFNNAGAQTLSGDISGSGAVNKLGAGTQTLSAANTYTGVTTVTAGVLSLNNANALPGGIDADVGAGESALTLNGGVIGLTAASGDFLRALGTGAGQVQWTAAGGFTAYGGDRLVNLGGASAGLTWAGAFGSSGLILSSFDSDSRITFQNSIDLNGAVRTITVANGTAVVDAELSGVLTGATGGMSKAGPGTLLLSAANTYGGATTIGQGVLLLGNAGDGTNTPLGTTGGNTTVSATGGALDLGGITLSAAEPLTLNGSGLSNTGALTNSGAAAAFSGPITLASAASIGSTNGTLTITGGISGAFGLTIEGTGNTTLSTTALSANVPVVTKIGSGSLTVNVDDTANVAPISVNAGTLILSGAGKLGNASGSVTFTGVNVGRTDGNAGAFSTPPAGFNVGSFVLGQAVYQLTSGSAYTSGNPVGFASGVQTFNSGVMALPGGAIVIDNSGTNVNYRLGGSVSTPGRAVALGGASLTLIPSNTEAVAENLSGLVLMQGQSTITLTADPGFQTNVTAALLNQHGTTTETALIRGTNLGSAAANGVATLKFTAAPTLIGITTVGATATSQGVLPYVIVDSTATGYGTRFATHSGAATIIRPLAAGEMSAASAYTAASNVLLSGAQPAITANTTINSLTIDSGNVTMSNPAFAGAVPVLTLSSGGLLSTSAASTISGGVVSWTAPLNVFTPGANAAATVLTVSSRLSGNGLVKAGGGTLLLSSASPAFPGYSQNTISSYGNHSGSVYINEGTIQLGANNAIGGMFSNSGTNDANSLTLDPGGILDLNGKSQFVGALSTGFSGDNSPTGTLGMGGGTITGSGNILVSTGSPGGGPVSYVYAGSVQGSVGFAIEPGGGARQDLTGPNSSTGPVLINGSSQTVLRDYGMFSAAPELAINSSNGLSIDNTVLANINGRLNPTGTIRMSSGTLTYKGRAQTISTDAAGTLLADKGNSTITLTAGGTNANAAELTFGSLARTTGATLNFTGSTTFGQTGTSNAVRVFITNPLTGNVALIGAANNQIIPGVVIGGDLVSYNAATGIIASTYNSAALNSMGAVSTANFNSSGAVFSGGQTINALKPNGAITFVNNGDILTLTSGMIASANQTFGTTALRGGLTSSTGELILQTNGGNTTVNSVVSGANKLVLAGGGTYTLTANNQQTGGTTVDGGTLAMTNNGLATPQVVVVPNATTPTDGLVLSTATATMTNSSGQIGSGNIVTLNGGSTLNLFLNNTLAGLVLNNIGTGAPTVNTGGMLTLTGGVTTTSNNIASVAALNGRVILPASATFNVGAATFNGLAINPWSADLNVFGLTGSGTTTKSGGGVLQFNVPTALTGTLDVTAGGIQTGAANAGARLADVVLENGTWLNLNGQNALFGSLATPSGGTGEVTNSGALSTLTVGFTGANTTFAGSFQRFNDSTLNLINLTKIGAGTMTLTGNTSTASGTLTVNGGVLSFKDAGVNNFAQAVVVNSGGTLTLDDSGTTNLANRLTNTGVTLSGGSFVSTAAAAGSAETTTGALTFSTGESTVTINQGAVSNVTTFGGLNQNAGSTWTAAGTGIGTADDKLMLTGQGSGTVYLRGAVGNDFAVYDTTLGVKAYTGYTTNANINSASGSNFKLDATTTTRNLTAALSLNSLDITDNNVTLGSNGSLLPTQGLTLSAVLDNGSNATISTPVLALGAEGIFRVNGSNVLTVNSTITGGQPLTKTGTGTLTLTAREVYTGATTVNQGTLKLNSGLANTLAVVPTATTPTLAALNVNGGSLDLNGQNQAVGSLTNNNAIAGTGGSVINSGSLATFTSVTGSATTFAGQIGGGTDASPTHNALNLVKTGTAVLTLTSPNTYSGTTTIRGGGLTLKDSGSLLSTSTSAINVVSGTLMVDQTGLNPTLNPSRIGAAAPITLSAGGGIYLNGGASVDSSMTVNNVTTASGANLININTAYPNAGGTATINIGSLAQGANGAAVRFNTPRNVNGLGQAGAGGLKVIISNATTAGGSSVATETLLVNGLLPGWMNVISNRDNGDNVGYSLLGYLPTAASNGAQGVGALGSAGYPAVSATAIASAGPTDNLSLYNVTSMVLTPVTTRTVNSINYARTAGWSMNSQTDTLTIGTGTFLNVYSGQVGSMDINGGKITSGASALYMNVYDGAMVLNSSITDGASSVALVKQGSANLTIDPRVNIYNGSTALYANGATTINLTATSSVSALFVGMGITGANIPANTTITNIAGAIITLSNAATGAAVAGNLIFTAPTAATTADGSNAVTTTASTFVPTIGMTVTGPGTTPGTRITNVAGSAGLYALTLNNTVPTGTPTLSYGAQSNSYTGGTFVNEGAITFPAVATQMLPGDVTINGSSSWVTALTTTAAGQLPTTANVTINGGGTLTMNGTNTLASLTFANIGLAATANGAASLTLSAANAITATNDNLSITPTITGTALVLSNAAPVISVSGASPDGLSITALITSAGGAISKTGSGSLVLPVANLFTTGVNLNGGALIVDNNTALGTGALAIADGTALMSGTGVRTLNNLVSVAGSFTFGTLSAAYGTAVANNGVILSNTVTLAAGAHQITVDGLLNTSTISGKLTGGTNLTKAGPGTLVLNNATNNFGGSVTINGGTLQQNVAGSIPSAQIMNVAAGAAFNMNGIAQSVDSLNGAGSVINPGGAVTLTVNGSTNGSFSGVLAANTAANLSLVKDGGNTQTLSGINTYGGTTTVSNGTLLINGAITGTGAVTVGATGTLGGTGAIAGAVNVSGTLAPGASIGVLISGGLTFADNSKFQYQVNSSVPHATGADLQIVNGVLNFGNSVALQLSDLGTGSFGGGTVFSLVNYSGAWNNGLLTFGDTPLDDDSIFNAFGKNWTIDYNATVKGDNVAAAAAGHYVNITLAGLSAYKTWITNPTFGITDPAKQDALADPDNDGITNVTEFAFDTLPNSGASGPATLEYTPFMIHGQPVLAQFSGVTNAVFDRRATYLSDGLTYTVQFSADLVNWETSGVTPTAIDASDSTIEVVRVPYPATILGGTQTPKFFRVLVTLAE